MPKPNAYLERMTKAELERELAEWKGERELELYHTDHTWTSAVEDSVDLIEDHIQSRGAFTGAMREPEPESRYAIPW